MPRVPQTLIDIDLSETPYKEYEIVAAGASLGEILDLGDQPDRLRAGEGLAVVRDLVALFAQRVRSWNLDDDDDVRIPLPATVDLILSLDLKFGITVILSWLNAMTDVGDGLGKGSMNGQPSAPPNFPMEAL